MLAGVAPEVLGRGVYGAPDAVRLVNFRRQATQGQPPAVSRNTIARWLKGYDHPSADGAPRHSPPLWTPDFVNRDGPIELSFRDLIELRFVAAFRTAGVSLATIRRCYQRAVEWVDDPRPFSTPRFRTDGSTIFAAITDDADDGALVDLNRRQLAFRRFVEPSLKDLEYELGTVARWYPLGSTTRTVVLDPAYLFGQPTVTEGRVPTATLAQAAATEGSVSRVATLFEVPPRAVRDALLFEQKLAA